MTSVRSNIPAHADLAAAEATLKANIGLLRHCRAEPSATQIAAVAVVENVIVTTTKQHAGWARLRLFALRVLGLFLLQTPRLKRGRPKKDQHGLLPSLANLGIKVNHIATRALNVAKISEDVVEGYLATTDEPTEGGLLKYANPKNYSESKNFESSASASNEHGRGHPWWFPSARGKKYLALHATTASVEWYTPPEVFRALNCRFDLDVASPGAHKVPWIPADRHFTLADNGLEQDWGDAYVFMNAPYRRGELPQWTEKFREHGNGVCLVVDRTSTKWWQDLCGNADLILQVNKKIDFVRPDSDSDGDDTGTNALGSSPVAYGERGVQALENAARAGLGTLFKPCQSVLTSGEAERQTHLLRGNLVVSRALPRYNPEEIAERLVAADREKAGEVWRVLGERLASSMSILFLSGHGIENPG